MSTSVIIPLIRRVMPSIIAQDILGVQPMTAPVGVIFKLRARYKWQTLRTRYHVAPEFYHHFLRVNNRRRTQCDEDLREAGYWSVSGVAYDDHEEATAWCISQFGRHAFARFPYSHRWWFSCEEHAVMFRLTWCEA